MPRSIGRLGASACTIRSQHAHASFGRTCRITLNRAGTYSSISETSSPRCFNSPPQSGQAFCFGGYFRVSRGRCSGRGRRAGFAAFATGAATAGVCEGTVFSACVASSSSSRSSNCSISRSSFSDLRPNCMPPQLGDQQLQVFDLGCRARPVARSCKGVLRIGEKLLVLEEDQRLQRFGIQGLEIRKRRAQGHRARSMPETFLRARKKRTKKQNQRRKLRKKKIVLLTPPSAARNCAPAAASRSLPATSTTAPASAKPFRSSLAAR